LRAEHRLFRTFELDCPADWIVLHSLHLARREHTRFGEADFVVLIPRHGIVCVEAKTYLARTADGMWRFAPDADSSDKSPFRPASNAKFRILEWLAERGMPDMLGAAVVVPGMEVAVGGDSSAKDQIEWAPHQLVDRSRLAAHLLRDLLCEAESYESPRARLERRAEEVRVYTEEQYRVIDQLSRNPWLFVGNPAPCRAR